MTNGLMDSSRHRALFQKYSGDQSFKTASSHISNTNKRQRSPDATTTEAPLCKNRAISSLKSQHTPERQSHHSSLANSKTVDCTHDIQISDMIGANPRNHEYSDGEGDLYELLEVDYNDDCLSDDSDVMVIESTQKAIVIEDDDVDGGPIEGQSSCVYSAEGQNTSCGRKTTCDAVEIEQIVIDDDDEEENSRLSSDDRNIDKEDLNSDNSSIIEYERWMASFRSTDNNEDDDRVSGQESIGGEADADNRILADPSENNMNFIVIEDDYDIEDNRLSNHEHNSRDSAAHSNNDSTIQIDNNEPSSVSLDNQVNTDIHYRLSKDDDDEEEELFKSSKTNSHSSIANDVIVIDDDDEETTDKNKLASVIHGEDETCSYTLVDRLDAGDIEVVKPPKRKSVVRIPKYCNFLSKLL